MSTEGEDLQGDGAGQEGRRWYQRPWLASFDGFTWGPTSWGALVAIAMAVVAGVVVIDWMGSLF
ncbi:hypothetical protein FVO59_14175 [Microbacterium esteraromaticum]|uniref:Uncharacterized protein n=1 Tax=Microbacterium esteraromaticum TaxID=57043 RepID=A0A7D8AL40_9MICO|nr:hypothetical protein [Microbacterium esteraromaticum]QMU98206.1 hypothetical protein FVO59_14175 [Microbacterium esteraromaticum]